MTQEEFNALDIGDLVRHSSNHRAYVVTGNYGGRVTAVRTIDLTNPVEWQLAAKATYPDLAEKDKRQ